MSWDVGMEGGGLKILAPDDLPVATCTAGEPTAAAVAVARAPGAVAAAAVTSARCPVGGAAG